MPLTPPPHQHDPVVTSRRTAGLALRRRWYVACACGVTVGPFTSSTYAHKVRETLSRVRTFKPWLPESHVRVLTADELRVLVPMQGGAGTARASIQEEPS